jgi:hypothetical protein
MKHVESHRLQNNWKYAQMFWEKAKKKYGLSNWSLTTMDDTDKAGMCSYSICTIYISTVYMRGHICNYDKVKKVLLHEIAHALKPGHSHGFEWKKKCKEIGGDSNLAVSMSPSGMNWAVSCSKCKWRQEYYTKPSVEGKICSKCLTSIKVKYIK